MDPSPDSRIRIVIAKYALLEGFTMLAAETPGVLAQMEGGMMVSEAIHIRKQLRAHLEAHYEAALRGTPKDLEELADLSEERMRKQDRQWSTARKAIQLWLPSLCEVEPLFPS